MHSNHDSITVFHFAGVKELREKIISPSNAKATFVQITIPSNPGHIGMHWLALAEYSEEYPYARVSVILFSGSLHYIVLAKLATLSIKVKQMVFFHFKP